MPTGFDARGYLPRELYEAITDIRVRQPAFADGEADRRLASARARPRRQAGHPGRGPSRAARASRSRTTPWRWRTATSSWRGSCAC